MTIVFIKRNYLGQITTVSTKNGDYLGQIMIVSIKTGFALSRWRLFSLKRGLSWPDETVSIKTRIILTR
jgi:hypothetical protein